MRPCSIFDLPYTGTPRFNITLYKSGNPLVDARQVRALLAYDQTPPHYMAMFHEEYARFENAWMGMTHDQQQAALADPKVITQVYEWLGGWVHCCLYEGDNDQ